MIYVFIGLAAAAGWSVMVLCRAVIGDLQGVADASRGILEDAHE